MLVSALLVTQHQRAAVRTAFLRMADCPRPLSDVVGGLHGGKYQFGHGGDATFQGGAFADALAASSAQAASAQDTEPWPTWAWECIQRRGGADATVDGTLEVSAEGATVRISNVYRTWERFYATIIPARNMGEAGVGAFAVQPACGTLAPRGGANNACDVSNPYADSVTLRVALTDGGGHGGGGAPTARLRVRTEDEQWLFDLVGVC